MQNFCYLQDSFYGGCAVDDWLCVFMRHCTSSCTHIAKMFSILFQEFRYSTISSKCFHGDNWLELILWSSVVIVLWADTWNENSYWSWRDLHKLCKSFMDNFAFFFCSLRALNFLLFARILTLQYPAYAKPKGVCCFIISEFYSHQCSQYLEMLGKTEHPADLKIAGILAVFSLICKVWMHGIIYVTLKLI